MLAEPPLPLRWQAARGLRPPLLCGAGWCNGVRLRLDWGSPVGAALMLRRWERWPALCNDTAAAASPLKPRSDLGRALAVKRNQRALPFKAGGVDQHHRRLRERRARR